jgi:hypothetical protein
VASENIIFFVSTFASCDSYALLFQLSVNSKLKRYVSFVKPTVDAKRLETAVGANCP